MKRLIILALIAVACAPKQEVKWPEPGFTGASQDPLEAFTFDSTLTFKPLDSTEIVALEIARWTYYHAVKDSFPDMGYRWWGTSMRSWIHHTYDSLETAGKRYQSWRELMAEQSWFTIVEGLRSIDNIPDTATIRHLWDVREDTLTSRGFF